MPRDLGHAPRVQQGIEQVTGRVRERIADGGVALDEGTALAERIVREELRAYVEQALGTGDPLVHDEPAAIREILARITGFGALQPYLDDPEVEEIWVNAPSCAANMLLKHLGSRTTRRSMTGEAPRDRGCPPSGATTGWNAGVGDQMGSPNSALAGSTTWASMKSSARRASVANRRSDSS